jgi:hypothetical protein
MMMASWSPVVPNASSLLIATSCAARVVDNGAATSTSEPIARIIA